MLASLSRNSQSLGLFKLISLTVSNSARLANIKLIPDYESANNVPTADLGLIGLAVM
jgi:hypothetical protein